MRINNGLGGTFSSLENPNYRWYWISLLASFAAMQMQVVVRGWLVYDMTDSAIALGWVSAGFGIPILLFSLYGGAIVDRMDKRKLLIITQALSAVTTLVIAVLISIGVIVLWHLVAASVVNGLILAFTLPGRQAIIPQLVERHQIMNAVALGSGAMNVNRVVAPALGGVLVGVIGIHGVYYLIVICYLASAALLLLIPPMEVPYKNPNMTMLNSVGEGLRYVRQSGILMALLALAFVPVVFGMPYQMLMPIFAVDILGVGASGLGYLMGATGLGAVAGSLLVASLSDFNHKGWLLLGTCTLFGTFLILFTSSDYYYLSLFFLLGVGASSSSYMAVNNTLLQTNVEDEMRGRVMSIYSMTIGLFPLGVLPIAAIAESLSAPLAIGIGGVILVLFTIAMTMFTPILRRL
ncbi:MAG: MFS transporter [Chloroflexota bacterium]|nr:MFS transporter [Chloroflexota bacterium]